MIRGAILAAGLIAVGGNAASAETVFHGSIKITAVSAQCQDVNVGDQATSSFHPNIAGNNTFTGLSFVHSYSAIGYGLGNVPFDATFRNATSGGVGWGDVYNWTGSQIRKTFQSPATITNTTLQVLLRGQIKKHDNDPGGALCIATFIASYVKDQ